MIANKFVRAGRGLVERAGLTALAALMALSMLAACAAPPAKTATKIGIPIYVTPFYSALGPQVAVGRFSNDLGSIDPDLINRAISQMTPVLDELRPEQMYVAAIRLWDIGDKNASLYWFYEAQYRARLFSAVLTEQSIQSNRGYQSNQAYGQFQVRVGGFVNRFASCDIDNWIAVIRKVQQRNAPTVPDLTRLFAGLTLIPPAKWAGANAEIANGMDELIAQINANRAQLKQARGPQDC